MKDDKFDEQRRRQVQDSHPKMGASEAVLQPRMLAPVLAIGRAGRADQEEEADSLTEAERDLGAFGKLGGAFLGSLF